MIGTDAPLHGQVMIVTGAARGIGKAISLEALRQGASVGMIDRDEAAVRAAVPEDSGRAFAAYADITREDEVAAAVAAVRERLGPVTALVNNAGRNAYGDAATMTVSEWDEVFAVDLKGAWLMARAVIPDLVVAGGASIVNIASLHARLTIGGMFPYAAAKSGLVGMTRSLALDLAPHGVRVNAVSPGYIRTELNDEYFAQHDDPDVEAKAIAVQPAGRLGEPVEVASVVCFLASPAASFVSGAEWAVDGGLGARFA